MVVPSEPFLTGLILFFITHQRKVRLILVDEDKHSSLLCHTIINKEVNVINCFSSSLTWLVKDKHSSIVCCTISKKEKKQLYDTDTSSQCFETFFFLSDEEAKIVFVPYKPFQPRHIFVGRARAHLSEAHFRLIWTGKEPTNEGSI